MKNNNLDIGDFHWLIEMVQTIDVGLVVLDRDYKVYVWNSFMEAHSAICPEKARERIIFDLFPEIPEPWLKQKIDVCFELNNRSFTTWEQHPHIFPFKNYRPITGRSKYMYQNMTVLPLSSIQGGISFVSLIIYDVTDSAINKLESIKLNKKLEHLSHTDGLTLLNNRAYWEECLHNEYLRFIRTKQVSTLLMFDIDHFKNVNDTYGHPAGDEVIKTVASILSDSLRKTDIAGRYGGEEFTVILIDTSAKNSMIFAEKLRKKIESVTVYAGEFEIKFTISIGLAESDLGIKNHTQWIECADQGLYYCKEHGRNQTHIYEHKE